MIILLAGVAGEAVIGSIVTRTAPLRLRSRSSGVLGGNGHRDILGQNMSFAVVSFGWLWFGGFAVAIFWWTDFDGSLIGGIRAVDG